MTARKAWDRYAEVLARELTKEAWLTLLVAYESAETLAEIVAVAAGDTDAQKGNSEVIQRTRDQLRRALEATKDKDVQLPVVEMGLSVSIQGT